MYRGARLKIIQNQAAALQKLKGTNEKGLMTSGLLCCALLVFNLNICGPNSGQGTVSGLSGFYTFLQYLRLDGQSDNVFSGNPFFQMASFQQHICRRQRDRTIL